MTDETDDVVPQPKVWGLHKDVDLLADIGSAIKLCKEQLAIAQPEAAHWRANVWQRGEGFRVEVEVW